MDPLSLALSLFGADSQLPLPAQLAFLAPFLLALAFVGKWVLSRYDEATKAKDALYVKIVDQVLPAMADHASAGKEMSSAAKELLTVARELAAELAKEREMRIRAEERLRGSKEQ